MKSPEKFKNKYRVASARLPSWDYAFNGMYFITICTKNRKHYFGEIQNNEMHLNETGNIAYRCWSEIPVHFKFVELGEFIIMPNHVHGIIIINQPDTVVVGAGHALPLQQQPPPQHHPRFRNQGKNTVSAMVGSFKSAVTKLIRRYGRDNACVVSTIVTATTPPDFDWQSRFHDHIIRTYDDYIRISNYILNNPRNWREDKLYGT